MIDDRWMAIFWERRWHFMAFVGDKICAKMVKNSKFKDGRKSAPEGMSLEKIGVKIFRNLGINF